VNLGHRDWIGGFRLVCGLTVDLRIDAPGCILFQEELDLIWALETRSDGLDQPVPLRRAVLQINPRDSNKPTRRPPRS
jgi:hypothetical protein